MWSNAFKDVLDKWVPKHQISIEDLKPLLSSGFPWHTPGFKWDEITPRSWWSRMEEHFSRVFRELGISSELGNELSKQVHQSVIEPSSYNIYEDAHDALHFFGKKNFRQFVLSNHVPDLPMIVEKLGLAEYFESIFTSALIGFNKPSPEIFQHCLSVTGAEPNDCWMIGDNLEADVKGAESVGIKAILIRSRAEGVKYQADNLELVRKIISDF